MYSETHQKMVYPIIAEGIVERSVKPEQLQKLVNDVFKTFQIVPPCSTYVEEVHLCRPPEGDEFAVLLFVTEVVAELFLDACTDQFAFPFGVDGRIFELRRNYTPSPGGGLSLPEMPKDRVTVVYVNGVSDANGAGLKDRFEEIIKQKLGLAAGGKYVKVLCSGGGEAYLEFSTRVAAAALLERCTKEAGLLHGLGLGESLVMCRSSKCLPLLHASRDKALPQRLLNPPALRLRADEIWTEARERPQARARVPEVGRKAAEVRRTVPDPSSRVHSAAELQPVRSPGSSGTPRGLRNQLSPQKVPQRAQARSASSPKQQQTGTGGWIEEDEDDEVMPVTRRTGTGVKFVIPKKQSKLLPRNVLE